jgi:UDP-N-acetylmuramyl pentapeptide phosphotransferase/UDP-N-acetylglucosamine-1-phosphate transferase
VHALAFVLALLLAALVAPALLRALVAGGHVKANYRGRALAFPFGVLVLAGALLALVPLALVQRLGVADVLHPETAPVALYAFGVALLGLLDDLLGDTLAGGPRGWHGHARALLRGEVSTGALKAAGTAGLALYAASALALPAGRWLLASAVLVLATHAFNLLDLRPGRAAKALVVLGAGLSIGAASLRALWSLGLFAGPALVAGVYDLRERAMLGDTGASVLGALAGWWLVLTLPAAGQAVALVVLLAITVYGELRSLSALVERLPLLRHLDSLGRPSR